MSTARISWGLYVIATVLLLAGPADAFDPFRSAVTAIEEGNAQLGAGKPKEALKYYDQAAKRRPDDPGVQYDRALALVRLGRLDEARKALLSASGGPDRTLKEKSFYNLGNVLHQMKRFQEAANAYQQALRLDPGHKAAKWNLELALRRAAQEKKKKDQQKQQHDKQQKDQQKQQRKQDEQHSDSNQHQRKDQQPNDQQDKKGRSDKQEKRPNQQKKQQDQQRPNETPTQRRLDQVLNAIDRNDRSVQRQRARRMRGAYRRPQKDW